MFSSRKSIRGGLTERDEDRALMTPNNPDVHLRSAMLDTVLAEGSWHQKKLCYSYSN
jgi:hypothetical protein